MKKFKHVWLAALLMASTFGFTACDDDDDKGNDASSSNPAIEVVAKAKKHDTAILLCTFGSTFKESIKTYDNILADYEDAFPDADVYLSFTSRTCVNRVYAETGACEGKFDLAKRAKAQNLDAIHDTVHEMAKDEARHGAGFRGLLNRYFK